MVCVHNALQGGRVVQEGENRFTELCNDGKELQLVWFPPPSRCWPNAPFRTFGGIPMGGKGARNMYTSTPTPRPTYTPHQSRQTTSHTQPHQTPHRTTPRHPTPRRATPHHTTP